MLCFTAQYSYYEIPDKNKPKNKKEKKTKYKTKKGNIMNPMLVSISDLLDIPIFSEYCDLAGHFHQVTKCFILVPT